MAINFLLGTPGSGKGYESVKDHILPALKSGRKVITNIPLDLDRIYRYFGSDFDKSLISVVFDSLVSGKRPFSVVEDYQDIWRHDKTNQAPFYVIDECHEVIPRSGTERSLIEFAAKHRHHGQDWLLITQSTGKVCKDILDLVQVTYHVRKAPFLMKNAYISSVYDGIYTRSKKPLSRNVKKYQSKYFGFWRSHTASDKAIQEAFSNKMPKFPLFVLFFAFISLFFGIFYGKNYYDKITKKTISVAVADDRAQVSSTGRLDSKSVAVINNDISLDHNKILDEIKKAPFDSMKPSIEALIQASDKSKYALIIKFIDSSSRSVTRQNQSDLANAGYSVEIINDCLIILRHALSEPTYAYCDSGYIDSNVSSIVKIS